MDNYDIPIFIESSKKDFEKCFSSYLDKMEKLAKKRGEYDLLYEDVSDSLIWDYNDYRENVIEEQCQQMLKIIKFCKKEKTLRRRFSKYVCIKKKKLYLSIQVFCHTF